MYIIIRLRTCNRDTDRCAGKKKENEIAQRRVGSRNRDHA